MNFEVVSSVNDCKNKDTIYLILNNWDDWFTYSTLFKVRYIDKNGIKHKMSGVKIGQKGQGRSPRLPEKFSTGARIVVEKFGYGYSDIVDEDRNIQTILSETRLALNKAGIEGPYVLCPHSMSGIEALYWAQKYPDEIEAIIGLDMAVPEYYENMKINLALMKLGQYAADLGITRLLPTLAESDAIKHGTLTNDEKNRYRAIFYNRTATVTMINEAKSVKDNARIVAQNGVPQVPMLLFISDGTGGTGFDKETWRRIQEKYISEVESGKYIELDCPHYVHDYEYGRISEEIKSFLSD